MAINPTHLQSAKDFSTGVPEFGNIIRQVAEGYKMGNLPRDIAANQEQQLQANKAAELKNILEQQYGARTREAEIGAKQAYSNHMNDIFSQLTGVPKEMYGLKKLEDQFGAEDPTVKRIKDSFKTQIEKQNALAGKYSNLYNDQNRDAPSKASITANQKIIQSIDNAIPVIDDLLSGDAPGQLIGKYLHPDAQAAYEAKTATLTDSLVGALKLPQTNESINLVKKTTSAGILESDQSYRKRLNALKKDLMERRKKAAEVNYRGIELNLDDNDIPEEYKGSQSDNMLLNDALKDNSQMQFEEQKVINGKTYIKMNGEWHES